MCALHLRAGQQPYPGYELIHPLGQGGWGEVWKARRADGSFWALKFLPGDASHCAAQEIRALQAIRQLRHPHLLPIEQVWSGTDSLAIVMELADGSLLDLLEVYFAEFGTGITPEHLCYFLSQAASAIDFLNTRQHQSSGQRVAFRHCDVKPSNLLVLGRTVKLADFSLAVATTSPMWYHRRVGTLHYAGPEIFQGLLSDRSDQYALAVSYIHLRTGRLPFADTPDTFVKGYTRPAPDLDDLTGGEQRILRRALTPVPQDRWPSCGELMRQLSAAVKEACVAC